MSVWDDRFTAHRVHAVVVETRAALRSVKIRRREIEAVEARARLGKALDYIENVLASVDPELVTERQLDAIALRLEGVQTALRRVTRDQDLALLRKSANDSMDAAVAATASLPRSYDVRDVERTHEAATNFRQSAGQLMRRLRDDVQHSRDALDGFSGAIEDLKKEIGNQKKRLDEAIRVHQRQFAEEQARRNEEAVKAQSAYGAALAKAVTESETAVQDLSRRAERTVSEVSETLRVGAKDVLAELNELRSDAKRLVNVIGMTGLAGGYQQIADRERKEANFWRWVVIGAGGLAIAINIFLMATDVFGWFDDSFEWNSLIPRAFATLALLALAGYAARESGKHRARQNAAREMEVRLASLEAYLALFTPKEQKELKREKFDLFFRGSGDADARVSPAGVLTFPHRISPTIVGDLHRGESGTPRPSPRRPASPS